ncbi:MAG: phosphoribosylaminoimidazolesuccinocarboxamide synthase [Defluviitaleaceae bacterium]|nr:phosphoribosylaminoimidazolesuccinocarboxamide synthase [Defluviitaleaceae bacterium]
MKLIYEGKTKNVYENTNGTLTLKLKDDATGKDGVFDPGENTVGLSISGLGRESLRLSVYYFELLKEKGVPTHYISSDLEKAEMQVIPAEIFGKGMEFICRRKADGSFVRRYGEYVEKGADLGFLVEATIKDDARQDPPVTREALAALKIMSEQQYDTCAALTKKIAKLLADDLSQKGLELHDLKFEFGKNSNGEVMLIDEVSAGCLRVYRNGAAVGPMELGGYVL